MSRKSSFVIFLDLKEIRKDFPRKTNLEAKQWTHVQAWEEAQPMTVKQEARRGADGIPVK